jgi:hypothetical protein
MADTDNDLSYPDKPGAPPEPPAMPITNSLKKATGIQTAPTLDPGFKWATETAPQYNQQLRKIIHEKERQEVAPKEAQLAMEQAAYEKAAQGDPQRLPIPDAPKQKPPELTGLFFAMLALAALSGKTTGTPLTTALNSMSGLLEGMHTGNKEQYEAAYKTWAAETKKALAHNREMMDEYNKVLNNKRLSIQQVHDEIRMIGVRFGDEYTVRAIDDGQIKAVLESAKARQNLEAKIREESRRVYQFDTQQAGMDRRQAVHENRADQRQEVGLDAKAEAAAVARASKADPAIKAILDQEKAEIAAAKAAGMKEGQILKIKQKYDSKLTGLENKPGQGAPAAAPNDGGWKDL